MTSQDLFKTQPELPATVEMTKEAQIQPSESCLPQTMPESPIQSFVIKPANPKTGCKINYHLHLCMLMTHLND